MNETQFKRVIKTEIDTKIELKKKELVSSVGLCQGHNPQLPHHLKVKPRGQPVKITSGNRTNNSWKLTI